MDFDNIWLNSLLPSSKYIEISGSLNSTWAKKFLDRTESSPNIICSLGRKNPNLKSENSTQRSPNYTRSAKQVCCIVKKHVLYSSQRTQGQKTWNNKYKTNYEKNNVIPKWWRTYPQLSRHYHPRIIEKMDTTYYYQLLSYISKSKFSKMLVVLISDTLLFV